MGIRYAPFHFRCAASLVMLALFAGCSATNSSGQDHPEPTSSTTSRPTTSVPADSSPPPHADDRTYDPAAGEVIAENLEAPWSIAFQGDTPLISERDTARILQLDPSTGETTEIASIAEAVPAGEGGLLGLAVHGDDLYAYVTTADDNRILRFPLEEFPPEGNDRAVRLGDPDIVLDGIPKANNHNGGRIAFGPDGMLYATVGDAGNRSAAQDTGSLSGKILRLTPDGAVPNDNPFADSLVYSLGHRNPQGLAWDDAGQLYAAEFGQDTWDELNVIEPGSNYGWPEVEGTGSTERENDFVDPVQQWTTEVASPSGMTIAGGALWLAGLGGQRLFEIPMDRLGESVQHLDGEPGRLRDVVTAPDGSLWILTNNTDGRGDPGPGDDKILRIPQGG